MNDTPLCKCGCGKPVGWNDLKKKWNGYRKGHFPKQVGDNPLCKCGCGNKVNWDKGRRKWSQYLKGHSSKEMRKAISERWNNPDYRENMVSQIKERENSLERKTQKSLTMKALWETPEHRQFMSEVLKQRWETSTYRNTMQEKMTKKWTEPEYVEKMMRRLRHTPNNPESLLSILTPENVEYIGNGKWWRTIKLETANGIVIKHKNPDFKVKGQRKLIEFNGTYWHKNDYPDNAYQQAWAKIGYEILIVWDYEMKNIDKVLTKIANFIGQQQWQMSLNI